MIAILDFGMGNVKSLFNAIDYIGADVIVTNVEKVIDSATHLILPGVGAFGDAMNKLLEKDLIPIIQKQVFEKGKPIMGICLGMQILANSSLEHGFNKGLGWIDAEVIRFDFEDNSKKIPHMGWNNIEVLIENPLFNELEKNNTFYFVHSYYLKCNNVNTVAATSKYGFNFTAAVKHNNILGTQFHPEKSQDNGIQVLKNFLMWSP